MKHSLLSDAEKTQILAVLVAAFAMGEVDYAELGVAMLALWVVLVWVLCKYGR